MTPTERNIPDAAPIGSVARIIKEVEAYFDLDDGDIKLHYRPDYIVPARHVAFWLALELTPYSYPRLAREFDRNHSTIVKAQNYLAVRRRTDSAVDCACGILRAKLALEMEIV